MFVLSVSHLTVFIANCFYANRQCYPPFHTFSVIRFYVVEQIVLWVSILNFMRRFHLHGPVCKFNLVQESTFLINKTSYKLEQPKHDYIFEIQSTYMYRISRKIG